MCRCCSLKDKKISLIKEWLNECFRIRCKLGIDDNEEDIIEIADESSEVAVYKGQFNFRI